MEIEIEIINRQVIGMSRKAKIIANVQKCINESKPNNTNIDFNVNQYVPSSPINYNFGGL